MKKFILFLFVLFVSCNNSETDPTVTLNDKKIDSLLVNSGKNLQSADTIQKKSDSTTKLKVVKVITQIKYLTKEVEKFRTERITLMNQLRLAKESVIIRIDTVFVETKKNFWGKEKTSVNTKSETKTNEIIDSTLLKKEVIDTLNIR
jgi:hypothetical protein